MLAIISNKDKSIYSQACSCRTETLRQNISIKLCTLGYHSKTKKSLVFCLITYLFMNQWILVNFLSRFSLCQMARLHDFLCVDMFQVQINFISWVVYAFLVVSHPRAFKPNSKSSCTVRRSRLCLREAARRKGKKSQKLNTHQRETRRCRKSKFWCPTNKTSRHRVSAWGGTAPDCEMCVLLQQNCDGGIIAKFIVPDVGASLRKWTQEEVGNSSKED